MPDIQQSTIRRRIVLNTAADAFQNQDYKGAAANYESVLEIERNPYVMIALGQVYMQRVLNRLRAHLIFCETVKLLSNQPTSTVPYCNAKISTRGIAGIHALATAQVLGNIQHEHWNDHVRDLVNATVFSFSSTAKVLSRKNNPFKPAPTNLSAAINYYLAAKSACHYPFAEEREDKVEINLEAAHHCLESVAQYD